MIATLRFLMEI
ncbi:unnamed protein product [Linum tenue]|uniref:Uncharacterized protein n=1 Tax=Linum tenue TaxID=586396 RepID=A0AAV0QBE1_9ROSI|nr:unnamed protein product [Linum tenue]